MGRYQASNKNDSEGVGLSTPRMRSHRPTFRWRNAVLERQNTAPNTYLGSSPKPWGTIHLSTEFSRPFHNHEGACNLAPIHEPDEVS
jgi:hypothetical protein